MKIQEPLSTSRSLEQGLVEGRLDIPGGAELSRRFVDSWRRCAWKRRQSSLPHPDTIACTTGTTGERDAMSGDETVPIDTVLLKTASRCNIACSYCYVYQLGDQGWRRQPPTMSKSTVDAIVRRLDELRQAPRSRLCRRASRWRTTAAGSSVADTVTGGAPSPSAGGMHPVGADERDLLSDRRLDILAGQRRHGFRESRRTGEDQRFSPRAIRPRGDLRSHAQRHSALATTPVRRTAVFGHIECRRTVERSQRSLLVPAGAWRTRDELSSARRKPLAAAAG